MRWLRFLIVLLSVVLLGGCRKSVPTQPPSVIPDQSQTHEWLVKEAILSMRKTASSLNGVNDATSAEQAVKVLQDETQNLQSLRQRLTTMDKAAGPERDRVKQHSQDMIDASQKMKQASSTMVGKIKAGQFPRDLAQQLAAASVDYGKAMADFGQQATPLFE